VTAATPTRRERLRAATVEEIRATARRLLVEQGTAAVTLRAIARDMGMTAPALYRYYPSLETLVEALCAHFFDECSDTIEAARDGAGPDPGDKLFAACRAFRGWSMAHPAEFGLMFGKPLADLDPDHHEMSEAHQAGLRFAGVFAALFAEIWARQPFEVPEYIAPELASQLHTYVDQLGLPLPVGAVQLFLSCWIRLYGMVAMEVFGHLHFALTDAEPMFEAELEIAARQIGVSRP